MEIEDWIALDLALIAALCAIWLGYWASRTLPLLPVLYRRIAGTAISSELSAIALAVLAYAVVMGAFGEIEAALGIAKWLAISIAFGALLLLFLQVTFTLAPEARSKIERSLPKIAAAIEPIGTATFQVMFGAIAAATAVAAYQTYRANNGNAMLIALEERDRQLRTPYMMDKEGRRLMRIFADDPALSAAQYKLCGTEARDEIKRWAVDYVNRSMQEDPSAAPLSPQVGPVETAIKWTSIEELYEALWSTNAMLSAGEGSNRARAMMMHAIDYLFIVHDAFHAKNKGYFTSEERNMWRAYIDDLGSSPYFLLALEDGEKYSYLMSSIRNEIKDYMRQDPKLACILGTIYPSFLQERSDAHRQ